MKIAVFKKRIVIAYYGLFVLSAVLMLVCAYFSFKKGESAALVLFFCAAALASALVCVWEKLNGMGSEFFEIGPEGVSFHKNECHLYIPWDDIEDIALVPDGIGRYNANSFILFMKRKDLALYRVDHTRFNNEVIGVQYRKGIVETIGRYTAIPIRFIDRVE